MTKITARLIKKLKLETGTSKAGKEWQKQSYIFEQDNKYNNIICVELMGDKINEFDNLELGTLYEVYINIESREWNGKYFTNVKGWKATKVGEDPSLKEVLNNIEEDINDLPF